MCNLKTRKQIRDESIYGRNCKSAFNASVSNGIHRTSKTPPPPTSISKKKNLRKQSTQRITLLQSHTFTLTGSRHSSLTDPPSHAENEKHYMVKGKEQGRRERRSGSSGKENKARSVSRSILRCNPTQRQANQVMGRWRERVRVFAL